jgi:hypothetical protein
VSTDQREVLVADIEDRSGALAGLARRLVDAATGAAAAAFGGYLRVLRRITAPTRLTVRQGEDLGRPSELLVDVDPADERVKVTGQAVPIRQP